MPGGGGISAGQAYGNRGNTAGGEIGRGKQYGVWRMAGAETEGTGYGREGEINEHREEARVEKDEQVREIIKEMMGEIDRGAGHDIMREQPEKLFRYIQPSDLQKIDTEIDQALFWSGNIDGRSVGNIWETIELPALKKNLKVTQIVIIDPDTNQEKVIFERR